MSNKPRIYWADNAKAIGIIVVYYLHFVLFPFELENNETAYYQVRLLASFIIQLFFFMSGLFWKTSNLPFGHEVKRLFFRRLIPVFFFGLLILPFWLVAWRLGIETFWYGLIDLKWILKGGLMYLRGNPVLNWPTWFLVCLFTCELYAFWLLPLFSSARARVLLGISAVGIGVFVANHISYFETYTGIQLNTWFLHEGIVALGFYALGSAMQSAVDQFSKTSFWIKFVTFFASMTALLLTLPMNDTEGYFWVASSFSIHGAFIPYFITSISGIAFVLSASMLFPQMKVLSFLGVNTIALLGLNGIFHHILGVIVFRLGVPFEINNVIELTSYCIVLTTLSIIISVPFVLLFERYLPQFVGKSFVEGPILPNLESMDWGSQIKKSLQKTKKPAVSGLSAFNKRTLE